MTEVATDRYVAVLERLCAEGGVDRSGSSWLHPSTAQRVHFLRVLDGRPHVQRRFLRMMGCLELLVVATFVVSLTCLLALL
ncbi:MAG: hypothetical protein A2W31_18535 [Planctomycetes bacterium RBG_16_64_10]|nr:MAG: hypothetical protein A2W31_18535 [Planctomycetes bacterium RBG_16_64_10]